MPTAAALEFVGAPDLGGAVRQAGLAPRSGTTSTRCPHVRIGQQADLVVVAPATADLLAKAAHGLADDLLTNTLLTARCPVVFAPAMHTEMWEHPATQANVATLRSRGALVLEPAEGRLTGADTGKGRLPDPAEIFEVARDVLARGAGRATPASTWPAATSWSPPAAPGSTSTRCASSATAPRGCQGVALARTAVARGAEVTLVAANVALPDPAGVKVVPRGDHRRAARRRARRRRAPPTPW